METENQSAEVKLLKLKLSLTEEILFKYRGIHSAINGIATTLVAKMRNMPENGDITIRQDIFNEMFALANTLRQNGWQDMYNKGQYADDLKEIEIKRSILDKL